jgi:TonB-dependent starch-binding outer membrane protein SusC
MNLKLNTFLKNGLLLMVAIMLGVTVQAQRTVKGKLSDASSGEALIGANVVTTGSNAVTDVDGMYSINVPAGATVLTFSYTGYDSQTVSLGSSNVVDVALRAGKVLEDLVVVGYGSVKKSDATGAVNAITEKDFNKGVITSPEQLLQGRVAGVQVSANSGEPGGGINIRIRGTSSIRSGNGPLFVIDGVPLSNGDDAAVDNAVGLGRVAARNPLSFLNPDDIASIDILKDASATAIYGSRGANGVVLVTTKKGKEGKGTLDYGYSLGISKITKKYDLLSASEFAKANPAADQKNTTDWQDEVFQTALTHNHNLSFGGGSATGNYRFSLGYLDQAGIVKESGIKRYSARFSAEQKAWNNRLTLGFSATLANTKDATSPIAENAGFTGDLLSSVLKSNPTMPKYVKNDKGVEIINQPKGGSEANPLAFLEYYKGQASSLRGLGNISASLNIMEGLDFKTVLGFDRSFSSRADAFSRSLVQQDIEGKGRLYTSNSDADNKLMENYFTYNKKIGKIGFTGLLGYSYQNFNSSYRNTQAYDLSQTDPSLMITNSSSATKIVSNSGNTYDELQSFFGRVNFNISEKYLITASLRRDGSTKFGPNYKYGNFPSFAAKWRLIQEDFIPKGVFSDLGLRVGYGITGNQEIPHNRYEQRSRAGVLGIDGGGAITGGGSIDNVAFLSSNIRWETTAATNIGLDFGFLNNRISGSIELYNKNTTGLLIKVESAQPAPNPFAWVNLDGNVINKGIELSLNIAALDKTDFKWNVAGNVAYNKNTVENFNSIINTGEVNGQGLSGAYAQRIANGQPLFAYFVREFNGFDADGNTIYPNGDFQEFVGKSQLPSVTAGITNTFSYKGLDLNIFFNGVFGNYIYNNTANAFFTKGALANGRNVTKNVIELKEGSFNAAEVSTRFLEKGDFVRLANLSLGYNLKPGVANISNIRLFVTGQNLLTFTKYSGQDPEVNTNKALEGVPSFGIDYNAYPRARTWTLGANVSF